MFSECKSIIISSTHTSEVPKTHTLTPPTQMRRGSWPSHNPAYRTSRAKTIATQHHSANQTTGISHVRIDKAAVHS